MRQTSFSTMRRCVSVLLLVGLLTSTLPFFAAQTKAQQKLKSYSAKPSKDALKWADKELRRMSLDQKIGQLISVGVNATFLNQDSEAFKALRHHVVDNHVGGIILFRGPVYESVM